MTLNQDKDDLQLSQRQLVIKGQRLLVMKTKTNRINT